ncbi:MAG: hypothetical protein CEN91_211 [Candidatus Berkelbacteria bacterium Licking1014_85]|uniref:Uncharacterized protein n=1 Tax=Candidatus Berkelbacteria bacterium Licking1014_85 TaxID=2017148 RepID=A0A554LL11_9BACT|nr:MAG: hypothetical protein CEN91_211 [Candidatus Berkelbacteria bacterium Licking1014_85]
MAKLQTEQLKTLSNFCNDIAKGLFLYSLIGQGFLDKFNILPQGIGILSGILLSLLFLYVAIILMKGNEL